MEFHIRCVDARQQQVRKLVLAVAASTTLQNPWDIDWGLSYRPLRQKRPGIQEQMSEQTKSLHEHRRLRWRDISVGSQERPYSGTQQPASSGMPISAAHRSAGNPVKTHYDLKPEAQSLLVIGEHHASALGLHTFGECSGSSFGAYGLRVAAQSSTSKQECWRWRRRRGRPPWAPSASRPDPLYSERGALLQRGVPL